MAFQAHEKDNFFSKKTNFQNFRNSLKEFTPVNGRMLEKIEPCQFCFFCDFNFTKNTKLTRKYLFDIEEISAAQCCCRKNSTLKQRQFCCSKKLVFQF